MVKYKLLDWVPLEELSWVKLSYNPSPGAIELLKKAPKGKIFYEGLAYNPSPEAIKLLKEYRYPSRFITFLSENPCEDAIEILHKNINDIYWWGLCCNESHKAIELLRRFPQNICWSPLSSNPYAIKLLLENLGCIEWQYFSCNPAPQAIKLLRENPERINWYYLSKNPSPEAVALLRENPGRIHWGMLSKNESLEAIALLRENPERINWDFLSDNPYGLQLIKENLDKFTKLDFLYKHPGIFMRTGLWCIIKCATKILSLHKRAVERVNHPDRLLEQGVFQLEI